MCMLLMHFSGVSFLNVGSGTGYLSTMVGLIIGPSGINHGVELYQENVDYAQAKLSDFHHNSPWYDPVEFCDPVFVVGNGLLMSPGNMLYDRIYCGAGCPSEHAQLMMNMISVEGLLVMPLDTEVCMYCTGVLYGRTTACVHTRAVDLCVSWTQIELCMMSEEVPHACTNLVHKPTKFLVGGCWIWILDEFVHACLSDLL